MIALGNDHAGLDLKNHVKAHLDERGIAYKDFGTYTPDSCDYAVYAEKAARAVAGGECELGLLFCGTGVGISMAANKVKGIRAACCSDKFSAEMTRLHNDANMLCLGGRVVTPEQAVELVDIFLDTPFSGEERHARRIAQITAIENFDPEAKEIMDNVKIMTHPLIQHKISMLRDKKTGTNEFRKLVEEIAMLEGYEALSDLPTEDVEIDTPIETCITPVIAGRKLAIVPILRAGLGMQQGLLSLCPTAKVGFIGMYRDEETHEPVSYYCKLPRPIEERTIVVMDPMLATGGSAVDAISQIKKEGGKNIKFMCIIAAPEGLEKLHAAHPDVQIYIGHLDRELNDNAYICPGLGDAGDRIFGTK